MDNPAGMIECTEALAAECKFTVESRKDGDYERNLGGPCKRVTFEGYAT